MKKPRIQPLLTQWLLLALLWSASRELHAQDSRPYSLTECVRLALENNRKVQNSALDIRASEYRIKEVKSALLPTVDINSQYLYYLNVPSQYAPASAFG